ncbi:hypothetical protein ASD29_38060 [Streptomyces sp. Root1295]|nr:hypothetical protein ASD29_38060 [Streptomyces sp. Root1295]
MMVTAPNGPSVIDPYTASGGRVEAPVAAGSVNQTAFPSEPMGRTPQLSLTAAIRARPRPDVANESASLTVGRRGSWSWTETVSRSSSNSMSTVHDLSGCACR